MNTSFFAGLFSCCFKNPPPHVRTPPIVRNDGEIPLVVINDTTRHRINLFEFSPQVSDLVLFLMDPFDQVSFSFISNESSEMITYALKSRKTRNVTLEMIFFNPHSQVVIHSASEPNIARRFIMTPRLANGPEDSDETSEDIFVQNWNCEKEFPENRDHFQFPEERSIQCSVRDVVYDTKKLCRRLIEIFGNPYVFVHVNLDSSREKVIEAMVAVSLFLVRKYTYSMETQNDQLLREVLHTQDEVDKVSIVTKFPFVVKAFDKEIKARNELIIDRAFLNGHRDALYLKSRRKIILRGTNLSTGGLMLFFNDLRTTWVPQFTGIFIECRDETNIDSIITGEPQKLSNPDDISMIDRSKTTVMYTFTARFIRNGQTVEASGFHTPKKDGRILTFILYNNKWAHIILHPKDITALNTFADYNIENVHRL